MNNNLYCAVDIGGTKILLLLIDGNGEVLFKVKTATPEPANPNNIIANVTGLLNDSLNKSGYSAIINLSAVGICMAGFIEHDNGIVHQSPNLNWPAPFPLKDRMTDVLNIPVLLENDTNAAVLGEVFYGAARGHKDVIYITLSTGIGGGLFLDGRLYRGSSGFAGEIGHIKPFGKGRICKCGGYDCLETWASGNAIAHSAASLWGNENSCCETITTSWVFEQAAAGNSLASEIIEHAADNIGRGLANLVTLLNPSCIVIGGGVAANRNVFFEQVAEKIKYEAIGPSVKTTPLKIVAAQLEPEAGIWGMYALMTGKNGGITNGKC